MAFDNVMSQPTFTYVLTNDTMIINHRAGLTVLSITCTTTTTGTLTGAAIVTVNLGGSDTNISSQSITLQQNVPVVISNETPIDGLTIEAPTGCSIELIGHFG